MHLYSAFQWATAYQRHFTCNLSLPSTGTFNCVIPFMRGSHLLPSQLPWEHTGQPLGAVNLFGMHIFHQLPSLLVLTSPTQEGMEG